MQEELEINEIPTVQVEEANKSTSAEMGAIEKEDEEAYRDFVTAFLDRMCENCKKMREQIIIKAKCAGILPEDDEDEQSVPELLAALIPETQLKMVDSLRRRTVRAKGLGFCGLSSFPCQFSYVLCMEYFSTSFILSSPDSCWFFPIL